MSDSSTSLPSKDRFDTVLIVVLVVLGVLLGAGVLHTGFIAMFLLPIVAVMLSLVGTAIAHRRRFLAAFCAVTAVNVSWPVVAISRGLLTDSGGWLGLLQLVGLAWALPLGIVFYILWETKD
jgi:hypothetical protein